MLPPAVRYRVPAPTSGCGRRLIAGAFSELSPSTWTRCGAPPVSLGAGAYAAGSTPSPTPCGAPGGLRTGTRCCRIRVLMRRSRPHDLTGGGVGERRVLNQSGHMVGHPLKQVELAARQRPAGSVAHRHHPDHPAYFRADRYHRL